jgi:hypothetical protein
VRRSLSILLILLFGFPLVAPVFALGADGDATLPACCRKNGSHHCAMSMQQIASLGVGTHLLARPNCCPLYPKAIAQSQHHDLSFNVAALLFAEAVAHPAIRRQTEAWARVALDGARQKRGPPIVRLS